LVRANRLLPYALSVTKNRSQEFPKGWSVKKLRELEDTITTAQSNFEQVQYFIAWIVHVQRWMKMLQSSTTVTISLALRFIQDIRTAADDLGEMASNNGADAGEEACSLAVAEIDSVFDDWGNDIFLRVSLGVWAC
jgi:hypothetical protein